ncbi:MAG TPA: DUF998 domain-containing protein [Candidatus Bathyarchaeia archaeon]|jgi:hypothetical membrane protein|nr:DUF998 domain-containing protein [Candidatus Bathyarchaeia archaeon]
MQLSDRMLAGTLAFIGGVECLVGISVAEELYPGYSVSANYISDLGATCRASCTVMQPASVVFNSSVAILGGLVIASSLFFYRSTQRKLLTAFLVMGGIGGLGVGFFPETTGIAHAIFSLIVFLFGGLSAILSYQVQQFPMNYFSIVLGVVTLVALALFTSGNYAGLGPGGMERMIAYPALLWLVGFGAYLTRS